MVLASVAPRVMTWRQYCEAAWHAFQRGVLGRELGAYAPDFTKTIVRHYAIHAGGFVSLAGAAACTRTECGPGRAAGGAAWSTWAARPCIRGSMEPYLQPPRTHPQPPGGYAVLKGIQKGMKLPASAMLPSFAALRE
jgi:hypothetical protein